ncbi:amidase [Scandinavium sp. V105_16]|uniref:Amidase n=1 Tax=Scandinavium lactucae TaxID=3095028 RepID=A0AAJ2VWD5_9ENTR|nr:MULTISPECIES: amidase [unclassified Scandinavium]MDX6022126.1 amidase [Scandinavium sp. V105_16]MDX6034032.1 amidase [Scandinavium sp. V105_12]
MHAMRLIPPLDCREEIARRLQAITDNRHLNAILGVNPDAMVLAERYQQRKQRGAIMGPLHGVPLIVKDNIACAEWPITLGCKGLASVKAASDALVIQRLRAAGAIILARANMSEFAFDVRSRSSLGGDVRNPLQPEVTAGGSSGGSAAAVAAGMADAALGTDTGGSIRIPCSYTGLVGLRPAFRRDMLAGVAPLALSKDTVGPMVHTVRDAALLHAIMHGEPPTQPEAAPLSSLRLGVIPALQGENPAQLRVWHHALNQLRLAGATLVDVNLPILAQVKSQPCLSLDEFQVAFNGWLVQQQNGPNNLREIVASGAFLPEFRSLLEQMLTSHSLKTPQWLNGRRFQRGLYQALTQTADHDRIDAFVYPTVGSQPTSLDKMPPGCAPELAAISGLPAITLPCGKVESGLPVGMELLATSRDTHFLLAIALGCENVFHPD